MTSLESSGRSCRRQIQIQRSFCRADFDHSNGGTNTQPLARDKPGTPVRRSKSFREKVSAKNDLDTDVQETQASASPPPRLAVTNRSRSDPSVSLGRHTNRSSRESLQTFPNSAIIPDLSSRPSIFQGRTESWGMFGEIPSMSGWYVA